MSTPARDELWTLYTTGLEEYRYQLTLNNQRFQWYVTLDVALITIGTGLLRLSDGRRGLAITSLIFLVGATLAAFTARAMAQGVDYQHAARAQVQKAAEALGIIGWSVATTGGWKGRPAPWFLKIRTLNYALLAILGAANLAGIAYVLVRR